MTLKEAIKALTKRQMDLLNYAFENELSQYVIIGKVLFVGVNVENTPGLEILETKGVWSYGKIK